MFQFRRWQGRGAGCIGVGGRGSYIGNLACQLGDRVAAADVDQTRAENFAGGGPCVAYADYRRLLDRNDVHVVTIGTPDHWHTKIAIDAMKAGKDVFCEKPLTLTIDEGKKLCEVVRATKRILQVGTQQRSSAQFLLAVAIAQSGRLGKRIKATCGIGGGPGSGVFPTADPPRHLDWDAWLGQCPPGQRPGRSSPTRSVRHHQLTPLILVPHAADNGRSVSEGAEIFPR